MSPTDLPVDYLTMHVYHSGLSSPPPPPEAPHLHNDLHIFLRKIMGTHLPKCSGLIIIDQLSITFPPLNLYSDCFNDYKS